mgnify:CR=1 FL=1
MAFDARAEKGSVYSAGATALLLAVASIGVALGFEHIGGYVPCMLCYMERWAYYVAIPLPEASLKIWKASESFDAMKRPCVSWGYHLPAGMRLPRSCSRSSRRARLLRHRRRTKLSEITFSWALSRTCPQISVAVGTLNLLPSKNSQANIIAPSKSRLGVA